MLFAAIVFAVSGCGGDDDPEPVSKLVGKWTVKETIPTITIPGGDLRSYLIAQVGMGPEEADSYVIYLESGEAAEIEVSTLEFKRDGSYESTDGADLVLTGKWELGPFEKTLTVDKATTHEMTIVVTKLTETTLVLDFDLSDSIALPSLKYSVTMTLEKL